MNRRAEKSLRDALVASGELVDRIGDVTLAAYLHDRDLQLITERLVIAVGEAISQATRADAELLGTIPSAYEIIGTRNRIAHGYDEIRDDMIWEVAVKDIPKLRRVLIALLPNA